MHTKVQSILMAEPPPLVAKKTAYQLETMRPVISLIFIAPILFCYELACIGFSQPNMRTGIDQWLHQMLASVGIGQLAILPLVTALVLLVMHHQRGDTWQIKPKTFFGMACESLGLGLILFFGASAYHALLLDGASSDSFFATSIESKSSQWWASVFGYFGAGIYEELIFRLLLLPSLIVGITRWTRSEATALGGALLLTSVLFALSHYSVMNPGGVNFEIGSFVFQFLASIVFCLVFLYRGFGIAVGTHVAYDVLTQF